MNIQKIINKKNPRKLILILVLLGVFMFAFGYALVPLYNVFCKVTGLNGKTGNAVALSKTIDNTRTITIELVVTKNKNLPAMKFYPLVTKIMVHPGENKRIVYFAENDADKTITIQAIPSVTPGIAAKYLKKTECFCFRQQTLKKGEVVDFPVVFHVDPTIPKEINRFTLSYTLFGVR